MKIGAIGRVLQVAVFAGAASMVFAGEGETPQAQKKEEAPVAVAGHAKVAIETSLGTIKIELWADKAPGTVSNFLKYVDDKFYDGVVFHRVMKGFMIQGGAFSPDLRQKAPTYGFIRNEAKSDVKNLRGTIAMARTPAIDGGSCQFFINLVNNKFLDHRDETVDGFGYCVFGKVVEGMDVVDAIARVPVSNVGNSEAVPNEPVIMKSVRRDQPAPAPAAK